MKNNSRKTVHVSPDVMGGSAVFPGTKVPIQTLFAYIDGGDSVDDFLEGFPSVSREQVEAIFEAVTERVRSGSNILLDECIDRRFADDLRAHGFQAVKTTTEMGWGQPTNALLSLADAHFDVLLTVDRSFLFRKNSNTYKIAVIDLDVPSNRLSDIRTLIPAIDAAVRIAFSGGVSIVS